MPCSCIEKVDEAMAPLNGRLGTRFTVGPEGVLQTVFADRREDRSPREEAAGPARQVICPICGTAYTPPETGAH